MNRASLSSAAVVDLVEQAYGDDDVATWADGVSRQLLTLLPNTRMTGHYEYVATDEPDGLDFRLTSPPRIIGENFCTPSWLPTMLGQPKHLLAQLFSRTNVGAASEQILPDGTSLVAHPSWRTVWKEPIVDSLGMVFRDASGRGLLFSTGATKLIALSPRERSLLTKLLMHLGAGYRLVDRTRDRLADAEAVLRPDGVVLHAAEVAKTKRTAIEDGRRRRLEARKERADADKALEIWKGLVAGRWSLVDHFDTDGKRFLLAMKNAPKTAPLATLSPRERRVCALAAMGHRDKEVAYMLGLTLASVSAALHRARTKLNVGSRIELATAWKKRQRHA